MSVEDLKTGSYSAYARNKLIAEAFYLTGDIEKYGSGFLRIRDALSAYPTMKIDFKEIGNGFMATVSYAEQKNKHGCPRKCPRKSTCIYYRFNERIGPAKGGHWKVKTS